MSKTFVSLDFLAKDYGRARLANDKPAMRRLTAEMLKLSMVVVRHRALFLAWCRELTALDRDPTDEEKQLTEDVAEDIDTLDALLSAKAAELVNLAANYYRGAVPADDPRFAKDLMFSIARGDYTLDPAVRFPRQPETYAKRTRVDDWT